MKIDLASDFRYRSIFKKIGLQIYFQRQHNKKLCLFMSPL